MQHLEHASRVPFSRRSFDLPRHMCVQQRALLCAPAEGFFQRAKNKPHALVIYLLLPRLPMVRELIDGRQHPRKQ
jgi:hypothetical protein